MFLFLQCKLTGCLGKVTINCSGTGEQLVEPGWDQLSRFQGVDRVSIDGE